MTVDIGDVLSRGVRRTTARNGLVLVGLVYVLRVISGLFGPRRAAVSPGPGPGTGPGPGPGTGFPGGADVPMPVGPDPIIPVSPLVAAVVGLVFALLSAVLAIGALRIFLTDERQALPADAFTRSIGWVLLNVVVGWIVFGFAVFVGLLLLVVPGVFLMVALAFWTVVVVDDDTNFVVGFRRSWQLTSGRRLRLFLLGLVVFVLVVVVNLIFGAVGGLLGFVTPILGVVIGQIGSAFTTVFVWAALAAAYRQLDGGAATGGLAY